MSTKFLAAVLACLFTGLMGCDTQPHYYPPPPVVIPPSHPVDEPTYYAPPTAPAVVVAPRPGVVFMPPPVVYAPPPRSVGVGVERSVAPVRVPTMPSPAAVQTGSASPAYATKVPPAQPVAAPSGGTLSGRAGMMTGFRANTGPAPLPGVRQVPPSVIPPPPVRPVVAPVRAPMPAAPASPVRPPSFTIPSPSTAARPAPSTSWGRPATSSRTR